MAPDPKPQKRYRATRDEWAWVETLKTGRCQCCGWRRRSTSWHHLVGRDLGGDDVIENLAELCGDGVSGCHGAVQRLERPACRLLRSRLRHDQIDYVLAKKGSGFLDRYLPP